MSTAPPDTSRQTRLLVFVAISAAFLAIAVPPVGLACGVGTLVVLGVRRRRKLTLPRPAVVVAMTAGVFAVLVGGLLSLVLLLIGAEMATLRECLAGANTQVAEKVCQDDFADALQGRLLR